MIISPPQAWSMLQRHADADVRPLRLAELRNRESEEEAGGFVAVHRSDPVDGGGDGRALVLDWSRQRMTADTLRHLLRLSAALEVRERIRDLAWGRAAPGARPRHPRGVGDGRQRFAGFSPGAAADPSEEEGGSMHLALRAPRGALMRDPCRSGGNALNEIHAGKLHDTWR